MFYENKIKLTKKTRKYFKFNMFDKIPCSSQLESEVGYNNAVMSYNFMESGGKLVPAIGIQDFQMPTSLTNLNDEVLVPILGNEVQKLYSFAWFDRGANVIQYYLFYFNDDKKLVYENLFWSRPLRLTIDTEYNTAPAGISYRINDKDYMIFAAADGDVYVFGSDYNTYVPSAPKLMACCNHDERVYALTAHARHSLVYSEKENLLEWTEDLTKNINFSDERGNINKIISFRDYLYLIRDFGITKVSTYSTSTNFSINHVYQTSSYIYPNSIASDGENIYFMTDDGFYSFNGNKASRIVLACFDMLKDFSGCNAACFKSKYYLACKVDFKDKIKVGCENFSGGFVNNAIFVFDIANEKVEFIRGVDVAELLALNNPYKSKLVMRFNNEKIGHIGELTSTDNMFGKNTHRLWESPFNDYGEYDCVKRIESFSIKSTDKCTVTIISERDSKVFKIDKSDDIQTLRAGIIGKKFKVRIESDSNGEISDLLLNVSEQ